MNSFLAGLASILIMTNWGSNMNMGSEGDLKWTNFTDGMKEASATNKKVLIDVYTDWCGWCKKMESDTYSDKDIRDYLMQNYVLVKLNAESDSKETYSGESMTQEEIAAAFRINGYPSTVFLNPDGQPITVLPGYLKPAEFMQVLKYIGEDIYKKMEFKDYLKLQGAPAK